MSGKGIIIFPLIRPGVIGKIKVVIRFDISRLSISKHLKIADLNFLKSSGIDNLFVFLIYMLSCFGQFCLDAVNQLFAKYSLTAYFINKKTSRPFFANISCAAKIRRI